MDNKDNIDAVKSNSNGQSNASIRIVDKVNNATPVAPEVVAKEETQKKTAEGEQLPTAPKDSLLQQKSAPTPPISPSMNATIQRIAEKDRSAPPPKASVSLHEKSQSLSKAAPKSAPSSRTSSKSPPSSNPSTSQIRQRGSPSSSSNEYVPPLPPRPGGPRRTSSQDGNFFSKVKKHKEQVQAGGLKAASFFDKVSHVAWDKLKSSPRLNPKHSHGHGRSASPQNHSRHENHRDTSNDIDVFGMDLKQAVMKTRIVKERKMGGDAAFWIPAIAYRCLQYLNVYGPHELGIYRVSGSTSVVDDLRADFKIRHDVDLFEDPPDDLHTVSSLLKGWFRSLPDAVLPLDVQKRIYDKCKDETDSNKPPQAFIDELSNLPPYNYYLLNHLFSHLSTICLASDVNKMNLSNLGMIFCSTLRIDRFCFNWLVNSWADCWAGCLTEEDEYNKTVPPPVSTSQQANSSGSRSSSQSRATEVVDGNRDRSASTREHTPSPLARTTSDSKSEDQRADQSQGKEKEDQDKEKEEIGGVEVKECEREQEREKALEIREIQRHDGGGKLLSQIEH